MTMPPFTLMRGGNPLTTNVTVAIGQAMAQALQAQTALRSGQKLTNQQQQALSAIKINAKNVASLRARFQPATSSSTLSSDVKLQQGASVCLPSGAL